jgi:hypothetical protein
MLVPERDIAYFAVLEAIQGEGCPLCRMVEKRVAAYIERQMEEAVTSVNFRAQWRDSRGFCPHHSWLLADVHHVLALAIFYGDLVDNAGEKLLTEPVGRNCPACHAEAEVEKHFQHVVTRHWPDAELQATVAASDGLCGPHLRAILPGFRLRPIHAAFLAASARRLKELAPALHRLAKSFDSQVETQLQDSDADAWLTAMKKIVGARKVKAKP